MSIASEITRLQGVKSNILDAIAAKGVSVPSGAKLADCPELISLISGGGEITADNVVNIVPIGKMVVVDSNGYIGFDLTNYFSTDHTIYYKYAILSAGDNFSDKGLGQVTFFTPAENIIGGRTYRTVIIGNNEWLAENLDFKFNELAVGLGGTSSREPRANYYDNDEATYGANGNKYGLLYNWVAVNYLNYNRSSLIPGWHVPTIDEVNALASAVGGTSGAGTMLKSTTGWTSGAGTDSYRFSAFPAGRYNDTFSAIGSSTLFWTANAAYSGSAYRFYINPEPNMYLNENGINNEYSVRLVKDTQ